MEATDNSVREQKVDALLTEADRWLTAAEQAPAPEATWTYCRKAITHLLLAYLWAKGEAEPVMAGLPLSRLWEEGARLDPELLFLATNLQFFLPEEGFPSAADRELLLDAANEVWDFIFGALTQ